MKCPKCFAELQQVEIYDQTYVHTCPKCSGAFYTESELSVPLELAGVKPGKWPCPSCAAVMETGTVCDGKIELDRCTDCGGFWFDAGELESLSNLEHVKKITKHVGAVGDFDEPEDEDEEPDESAAPSAAPEAAGQPHLDVESWWHKALRYLLKPTDSNKPS